MPVETRPTSRFWYGRWRRNGRRFCKRLKVLVVGNPGSDEFDDSRQRAEAELLSLVEDVDRRQHPEDLVQRLHEVKFGKRIGAIRLGDMVAQWRSLPRKREPSPGYIQFAKSTIDGFVAFVLTNHSKINEMSGVTPEIAEAFMRAQDRRGVSPKTYNTMLTLLRSTFERLRIRAGLLANPFKESLILKEDDSIHRQPFTVEELDRIFAIAQENDPLIYGVITVGACTALRKGDACCLKWEDIDPKGNRIRISTRKTGQKVVIPIFPRLRALFESLPRQGSSFVFPALAAAHASDPSSINRRLNRIFELAGIRPVESASGAITDGPVIDIPEDENVRPMVMVKIQAMTAESVSPKIKDTMIQVFDLYSSGMTLPDIARKLDISKGSVSNYLARIEKVAGHPIVRKEICALRRQAPVGKLVIRQPPRSTERHRLIRVNPRGFHALRATFTTLALTAGVPVEVVKIITGHTLTETVLKHYFNPDEHTILRSVQSAMPQLLTGQGRGSVRDDMLEIINNMTRSSFKKDCKTLKSLAERLPK